MSINVGDTAPNFNLYDSTKQKQSLHDYVGTKTIVLAFYPGAFTGACDTEVCELRDSMTKFNNMNAQVIGVSVDSPMVLAEFSKKYDLNFPLLSDFDRSVIKQYDVLFNNLGAALCRPVLCADTKSLNFGMLDNISHDFPNGIGEG